MDHSYSSFSSYAFYDDVISGFQNKNDLIRHHLRFIGICSRKNFPPQRILTLPNLISEVANLDVTIFLLVPPHLDKYRDQLRQVLAENISVIQKRLVIVSASPVTIYHLKNLEIVCGLWLEQPRPAKQYMSTLNSVKGAFLRNIIAPVTGIKVVFIHKSEFNE